MQTDLITDSELGQATEALIKKEIFKYTSKMGLLKNIITRRHIQGLPEINDTESAGNFKKVTKEDVREMARKYIHWENMMMIILGDKENFDRPLEEFGKVEEINIQDLKDKELIDEKKANEAIKKQNLKKGEIF
jgi:hypothetical protein